MAGDTYCAAQHPSSSILSALLPALLLCTLIFWVYLPALTTEYAHTDDFWFLGDAAGGYTTTLSDYLQGGRFLRGVFKLPAAAFIETAGQLQVLRVISVTGICAFALTLAALARAGGLGYMGYALSALTTLTPAFAVYAGWASVFLASWGAALALAGGWLCTAGRPRKGEHLARRLGGAAILAAVMTLYQPLPAFFIVAALIVAGREESAEGFTGRILAPLVIYVCVAILYLAHLKLMPMVLEGGIRDERTLLLSEGGEKYAFLLGDLAPKVSGLWGYLLGAPWSRWTSGAVILLASAGLWNWSGRGGRTRRLAAAFAVLFLATAPYAIIDYNYAPFRVLSAHYTWILLFTLTGIGALAGKQHGAVQRAAVNLIFASSVLLFALAARHYLVRGLVVPQALELSLYREHIRRHYDRQPGTVLFVKPKRSLVMLSTLPHREEFNNVSSVHDWVPEDMLSFIFREQFARSGGSAPAGGPVQVDIIEASKGLSNIDGAVVDGGYVTAPPSWKDALERGGPPSRVDDPYWGALLVAESGTAYSPWFGFFRFSGDRKVQHSLLGSIIYDPASPEKYWFNHPSEGWIWTDPASYPVFLRARDGEWLQLSVKHGRDTFTRFMDRRTPSTLQLSELRPLSP